MKQREFIFGFAWPYYYLPVELSQRLRPFAPERSPGKILWSTHDVYEIERKYAKHWIIEKTLPSSKKDIARNENPLDFLEESLWHPGNLTLHPLLPQGYGWFNDSEPHFSWIEEYVFEDPIQDGIFLEPVIERIASNDRRDMLVLTLDLNRWQNHQVRALLDRIERKLESRRSKMPSKTDGHNSYHVEFSIQFYGQADFQRIKSIATLLSSSQHLLSGGFGRVTMPSTSKGQERRKKKLETQLNQALHTANLAGRLRPDVEAQRIHRAQVLEASLPTVTELLAHAPGIGTSDFSDPYWQEKSLQNPSWNFMTGFSGGSRISKDYFENYGYFHQVVCGWVRDPLAWNRDDRQGWQGDENWGQYPDSRFSSSFHKDPSYMIKTKNLWQLGNGFGYHYEKIVDSMPHEQEWRMRRQYDPTMGEPLTLGERRAFLEFYNYYAVLQIAPTASAEEIRTRYRKLALEFHPDKNSDPLAVEHFLLIKQAYKHLTNPPTDEEIEEISKDFWISQEEYMRFFAIPAKLKDFKEEYIYEKRAWDKGDKKREAALHEAFSNEKIVEAPDSPRSSRSASLLSMSVEDFLAILEKTVLDPIIQEEQRLGNKKRQWAKSKIKLSQIIELKNAIKSSLNGAREAAKTVTETDVDKRRFYLTAGMQLDSVLNDFLRREHIAKQPNLIRRFLKRLTLGLKRVVGVAIAVPTLGLPLFSRGYRKTFFNANNDPSAFEKLTQKLKTSVTDHTNTEEKRAKIVLTETSDGIDRFYQTGAASQQKEMLDKLLQQLRLPYPKTLNDWYLTRQHIITHLSKTTGSFGWLGRHRLSMGKPYLEIFYLEWLRALCTHTSQNLDAGQSVKEALLDIPDWQVMLHELITVQEAFDLGGETIFGKLVHKVHIDFVKIAHEHKAKLWLRMLWGELPAEHFASQVDHVFTEYDAILARHLTSYRELLAGFYSGFGSEQRRSEALMLLRQLAEKIDTQYNTLHGQLTTILPRDKAALDALKEQLENRVIETEKNIRDIAEKLFIVLRQTPSTAGCWLAMPAKSELSNEILQATNSSSFFHSPSDAPSRFAVSRPHIRRTSAIR